MATQPAQAAAAPAEEPPRKGRRWRRIARRLAILALVLALFVAFLPTIIWLLPVGRIVSSVAKSKFNTTVKLEGFSLGWVSPLRVRELVVLETAKGASTPTEVFALRDLRVERGLLANIFATDRFGKITIAEIGGTLVREADGSLLIPKLPPSAPAPPEPPTPPRTRLVLSELIPTVDVPPLPIDIEINKLALAFDDRSTSATVADVSYQGPLTIKWNGKNDPVAIDLSGVLASADRSIPLAARVRLEDWIANGKTTLTKAKLRAAWKTSEPEFDESRDGVVVQLAPDRIDVAARVQAAMIQRIASVPLPLASAKRTVGQFSSDLALIQVDPQTFDVTLDTKLGGVEVEYERPGAVWKLPDLVWDAKARANAITPALLSASSDFEFGPITSTASLVTDDAITGAQTAKLYGAADLTATSELIDGSPFVALVPASFAGTASFDANATMQAYQPSKATLAAKWDPKSVTLRGALVQSTATVLKSSTVDLTPLSGTLAANIAFAASKPTGGDAIITTGLATITVAGELESPTRTHAKLTLATEFAPVLAYANAHVQNIRELTVTGPATLGVDATIDGDVITADVDGAVTPLTFAMGPNGIDAESMALHIHAVRDPAKAHPFSGTGWAEALGTRTDFSGSGASAEDAALSLTTTLDLDRLEPVLARNAISVPVEFTGGVRADLEAARTSAQDVTLSTTLASASNFMLTNPDPNFVLRKFSGGVTSSARLDGKDVTFVVQRLDLSLNEFLDWKSVAEGSVKAPGAELSLRGTAKLAHGPLLDDVRSIVEKTGYEVALDGDSTIGVTLAGKSPRDAAGAFVPPYEGNLALAIDAQTSVTVAGATIPSVSIGGLSLHQTVAGSYNSDLPMPKLTDFSTSTTIASVGVAGMAELTGIALRTTIRNPQGKDVAVDVPVASIGSTTVHFAGISYEIPRLDATLTLSTANDLTAFDIPSATLDIKDFMRADASGRFDKATMDGALTASASIPDLEVLARYVDPATLPPGTTMPTGSASGKVSVEGNFAPADPFTMLKKIRVDAQGVAEGISFTGPMNSYMKGLDADGSFQLGPDSVSSFADLSISEAGMEPKFHGILDGTSARLELTSDLRNYIELRDASLMIPNLQTNLSALGQFSELDAFRLDMEERPNATMSDRLGPRPMVFFAQFDQGFDPFAAFVPNTELQGSANGMLTMMNVPGSHFEATLDADLSLPRVASQPLVAVDALFGSTTITKAYKYSTAPASVRRTDGSGKFNLGNITVAHPAFRGAITNSQLGVAAAGAGLGFDYKAEDFFGGPASATVALAKGKAGPSFNGEFAVTGLDATSVYPSLATSPKEDRTLNGFGSFSIVFPDNGTVEGLLNESSLRFQGTRVSGDILRAALRAYDPSGSDPKIQATMLSLRFGRPTSALLEIRGGLLNASFELRTAGGININVPILERVPITGFVGAYELDAFDPMVATANTSLKLVLAETFPELLNLLTPKETQP